jgi:DNA-directed RNA polymerase
MNRMLREAFVELHSEPLLEQLAKGLEEDFPEVRGRLPPPPAKGTLDLNVVRDSAYFFS